MPRTKKTPSYVCPYCGEPATATVNWQHNGNELSQPVCGNHTNIGKLLSADARKTLVVKPFTAPEPAPAPEPKKRGRPRKVQPIAPEPPTVKRGPGRPRKVQPEQPIAPAAEPTVKRGPGRPRKVVDPAPATAPAVAPVKRGPGRPKKVSPDQGTLLPPPPPPPAVEPPKRGRPRKDATAVAVAKEGGSPKAPRPGADNLWQSPVTAEDTHPAQLAVAVDPLDLTLPQVGDLVWVEERNDKGAVVHGFYRRIVTIPGWLADGRLKVYAEDVKPDDDGVVQSHAMALTLHNRDSVSKAPVKRETRHQAHPRPKMAKLPVQLQRDVAAGVRCRHGHDLTGTLPNGKPALYLSPGGQRVCRACQQERRLAQS